MIRYGITGTDTGVGKTVVACALIAALRDRGLSVAAMKPVETGVDNNEPSDARRLWDAAGGHDSLDDVCPERFDEPLAPWVAARRAGRPIALSSIEAARTRLETGRDALIVEGAGGLLVPLTDGVAYDTLFRRWGLDCIIVAANRLGAVNHTLLTLRAARAAGLRVRAVVLNTLCPGEMSIAEQTNFDTLRRLVPDATVLSFPYQGGAGALAPLL
ncbi:MAG TPA: dethiobiotin synthase [Gemmatimonadaceae bacterium]|nr:dethiobiotin synthase [Gemmatimonadaceae bacterium]